MFDVIKDDIHPYGEHAYWHWFSYRPKDREDYTGYNKIVIKTLFWLTNNLGEYDGVRYEFYITHGYFEIRIKSDEDSVLFKASWC
jgi:hypothetical protein